MKAPSKGGGYELEGYGMVTVKGGPSPEYPYVKIEYETVTDRELTELHIEEFKEQRLR